MKLGWVGWAPAVVAIALAGCGSGISNVESCPDGQEVCAGDCVPSGTCTGSECASDGATESCYPGPAGSIGEGPCSAGTRTCAGGAWSECENAVLPVGEVCGNDEDEDCDGEFDEDTDEDGDGYTTCGGGDCCDAALSPCADPSQVNPGAYDVPGNGVDDDCNGGIDDTLLACDMGLTSDTAEPLDYARAIDLCETATEDGGEWGVLSASFTLADGTNVPNTSARAIRGGFGTGVPPLLGDSLAVLSTGHAADEDDVSPAFTSFQGGVDFDLQSAVPMDWLMANGNDFPNAPGCPEPEGGAVGNDPIMLTLRVRVPTNAQSFTLRSNFYSAEYPEWVCSPYNDFFVVLLDSTFAGDPGNPMDKNLAVYTAPDDTEYPVGVNLAFGNTGLFRECVSGETGCGEGSVAGSTMTCTGVGQLAGTGFDEVDPEPHIDFPAEPGYCGASNLLGGATGWLETRGNVVPGEVITLRIATWDTGDPWYDSVVLLDHFEWSPDLSDPGTGVVQ